MQFTIKRLYYSAFLNFSKIFKTLLKKLVKSWFLVAWQSAGCKPATPVEREFFEISRSFIFQNITIYVIKFSTELQNVETSSVTTPQALPSISKNSWIIHKNLCNGVYFQDIYKRYIGQLELVKKSCRKDFFSGNFAKLSKQQLCEYSPKNV